MNIAAPHRTAFVIVAAAGLLVSVAGCADPARNVYEGVRTSGDATRSPVEKATQPSQSYEDYERERRAKSQ